MRMAGEAMPSVLLAAMGEQVGPIVEALVAQGVPRREAEADAALLAESLRYLKEA